MKIFSITRECWRSTYYEFDQYKDTIYEQHLAIVWRVFGVVVYKKYFHSERVPSYAIIQKAAMGFSDWKSENAKLIDFWSSNQLIFLVEIIKFKIKKHGAINSNAMV